MTSFSSSIKLGTFALLGLAACKKDDVSQAPLVYTTVSTLAGTGTTGSANGAATVAQFSVPEGVAVDAQGNVYVADNGNSLIRKITPAGVVSTLAGNGTYGLADGPATTASFSAPADVALDGQNNVYVADFDNNCIRKITPAGVVSTLAGTKTGGFADGAGSTARFSGPNGLVLDAQGNVYVSDYFNHVIRKVTPAGVVSTFAGTGTRGSVDGPGSTAQFMAPEGLAIDAQGTLFVADFGGGRIRKITAAGVVSTLAGTGTKGQTNGPGNTAQFSGPTGIALDPQGNAYVADFGNNNIRKITPDGVVSTLAGTTQGGFADGPVATAQFNSPTSLAIDTKGALYTTDFNNRVRKITAQ